jgi:hypothetical protein
MGSYRFRTCHDHHLLCWESRLPMKNFYSPKRPTIAAGLTRRRLLKGAGGLAIAAAAQTLMPPNLRRVLAQGLPRPGSMNDVKHVVMLMQENRSFDHYFGTLAGVRGFDDPHALTLPSGKSVFHQPDAENPNGYLLPFHLDTMDGNRRGRNQPQDILLKGTKYACQFFSGWSNGGRSYRQFGERTVES